MKHRKSVWTAATLAASMVLVACSKIEEAPQAAPVAPAAEEQPATPPPAAPSNVDETAVTLDARVELPAGWSQQIISAGECMTPVDHINGVAATSTPYAAGADVKIVGWNVTSSKTEATPALIYGVLKPYDQAQSGVLLAGNRTERADVAGDNKQFMMAGYELSGKLPTSPGRYRFYVWTGTPDAITECDSKIVVAVQ